MAGLAAAPRPDTAIEIQLERDVWDKEMCPELFSNLHFNLMPAPSSSSSSSCVVLSAPAKKLESKLLQFASNAIIAVFGEGRERERGRERGRGREGERGRRIMRRIMFIIYF